MSHLKKVAVNLCVDQVGISKNANDRLSLSFETAWMWTGTQTGAERSSVQTPGLQAIAMMAITSWMRKVRNDRNGDGVRHENCRLPVRYRRYRYAN